MALSHLLNGPGVAPHLSFWGPSRGRSGESWGDSKGTDNKICLHNDFIDRTPFKLIPVEVSTPGPDTEMNLKLW